MLAVVGLGVPLGATLADRVDAEVRADARGQAHVVAASAADLLAPRDRARLERLVRIAGGSVRGRVIVVDGRGALLADSQGAQAGRDYSTRPEIRAALAGRPDQRERRSQTLDERLLATSVPVLRRGQPVGAVRVTQSVDAVDRAVRRAWLALALVGLIVVAAGLAAGWLIASWVARPTVRLDQAAQRVAEGDLAVRAREEGSAEQRSLARTFNEMTARLGRLLDSQREFVADASHQLRTPLAGLRLRLEAAEADTEDRGARAELEAAQHEVDRLAQMVGELLELSRAGERELPGERIDLADAARRACERWERTAGDRRLRVDGAVGEAWCARADLDRIVDALVENALRYGDGAVTIAAAPRSIRVLDEGPGLADDETEAVFDRFHRGSAGPRGTGLGLPIARELARRWGADVTIRNRDDGLGAVAELRFTDPLPGDA